MAELKQQSQGNYRNYLNTQLTDAGFVAAQSVESVFGAVYRSIQSTDTYAKNLGTTVTSMNAAVSIATTATAALSGQLATVNSTASSVAVAFNALPLTIRDGSLVAMVAAINASVSVLPAAISAVNASVQTVAGSVVAVGATVAAVNSSLSGRVDSVGVAIASLPAAVRDGSLVADVSSVNSSFFSLPLSIRDGSIVGVVNSTTKRWSSGWIVVVGPGPFTVLHGQGDLCNVEVSWRSSTGLSSIFPVNFNQGASDGSGAVYTTHLVHNSSHLEFKRVSPYWWAFSAITSPGTYMADGSLRVSANICA